ncbi:hypothetical protein ACQEVF_30820 [Nonomuraea polychroma]|uniref:hypothetical protein n=1 Tax=Nonomuraea polychroma TaxID=46176 RepID=UPI003D8F7720
MAQAIDDPGGGAPQGSIWAFIDCQGEASNSSMIETILPLFRRKCSAVRCVPTGVHIAAEAGLVIAAYGAASLVLRGQGHD